MKNKPGSNIVYASPEELSNEGYKTVKGNCQPGDLLQAAEGSKTEPTMLLKLSKASISASRVSADAFTIYRQNLS